MQKPNYTFNEEELRFEKTEFDFDTYTAILITKTLFIVLLFVFVYIFYLREVKLDRYEIYQRITDSTIIYLGSQTTKVNNDVKIVTATCYKANYSECDSTPLFTADGSFIDTTRTDELRWIAVSRDLEREGYKMGNKVNVYGVGKDYDGVWTIKDRMNKRFNNKIDFLIKNKQGNLFNNVIISKR